MAALTKWRVIMSVVFCLTLRINSVHSSQDLMQKMNASFFKTLIECKKKLAITDEHMKILMNFWRADQELVDRQLGCMIMCMASKHDLIESSEYKLHHDKAYEFAVTHGADDETAKQIVKMIHDCEKQFEDNKDDCSRTLDTARCFRDHIHTLKWAPNIEMLVEEIMLEA